MAMTGAQLIGEVALILNMNLRRMTLSDGAVFQVLTGTLNLLDLGDSR